MSGSSQWPRVLVITKYPFNLRDGGGVALTNYFQGWPKENIAQAYLSGPHGAPDASVCQSFFELTHREIKRLWPLSLYDRCKPAKAALPATPATATPHQATIKRGLIRKSAVSLKYSLSAILRSYGASFGVDGRISNELADYIRQFQPQIIFTTLGDLSFIRLTRKISKEFNIPISVQICDDWMSDQYVRGSFGRYMLTKLDRELRDIFACAGARFSICRTMSDAYLKRYGTKFMPLPVPVTCAEWQGETNATDRDNGAFVILYAGAIHKFAQLQGLIEISLAVERIENQGVNASFHILTPPGFILQYAKYFTAKNCRLLPYETRESQIEEIKNADMLVIPVNFDPESLRFIRYSMPAKLAAYMASGIPILMYGPNEVPPIIEAQQDGFAHCVCEQNHDKLVSAIRELLTDKQLRHHISERAVSLAEQRHDVNEVSALFRRKLIEACERHSAQATTQHAK